MKMRIGDVEVEGTPDELADFYRALGSSDAAISKQKVSDVTDTPTSGRRFVSEDIAFRVLRRRSLSSEQTAVLNLLKDRAPHWVTAVELQDVTEYNASQLAGLLGAFGKRLVSTPGYRKGTWFFDQEWDYENGCNKYRLPDSVLAAVNRALR